MLPELDRQRAAAATPFYSNKTFTSGDEPLIVDFVFPGQRPGFHYIVERLTFLMELSTRAPSTTDGFPPLSGLYLCPEGTPIETLAQAQAGWNPDARPFLLPIGPPMGDFATIAGGPVYPMVWPTAEGFKFSVPYGFFVRGILTVLQGSATPGPGAGSWGQLKALAVFEKDERC